MMRRPQGFRWAIPITLLVALSLGENVSAQTPEATGSSTAAQDPKAQEAEAAAARGKELYRDGKFVEALLEFKRAYETKPTAALSYNIGRCYEQLAQYDEAIKAYERFMTETTNPRDRTEASDKIEFLKTKIAADANSPEARYKARVDNGKKAFSAGDYEKAIQEFRAAYDLKPTSAVLFNIGKSYERMGRYEEAIDSYTQYLDLDPNASDRPDVEEQIRRLKKSIRERFQELSVSSEPPGADIYLDDRNTGLQGQTNFRFKVPPGPHTIYLDLNGYEPVKREFVMPDDKPLALEFTMKKLENVGYATINVNVEGARIFIDGAIIGLSPYKQKKALSAGSHQVTIEAQGYPRHTQDFIVAKDQDLALNVELEQYDEPVKDETLDKWGRNFLLIGLIGGGLGFAGPFAYQKLILRRPLTSHLGPTQVTWGSGVMPAEERYWKGSPGGKTENFTEAEINDNFRENPTKNTLSTIQTWSLIGGITFAAVGMGFYVYKWVRNPERKTVVTGDNDELPEIEDGPLVESPIEITGFGMTPTDDGAHFGLVGTF
jgi:tetratricopeptide (TPR) repeat protein